MTYCQYLRENRADPVHHAYHDNEYGFPSRDEQVLFERLVLEINQAGLNWELVLKRRPGMREAYSGFHVDAVAAYGEDDVARLLADPRIIRNRLKVRAAIHNAQVVQRLRVEYGSFASWLDENHPRPLEDWIKLFRRTFAFTGGEIVNEFLTSLGILPGAHDEDCPTYARIVALNPPWMGTGSWLQARPQA